MVEEVEIATDLVISDRRALFDRTTSCLAIADLHLGLEGAARDDGVYFPRYQKEQILADIGHLVERYSPSTVVVDGDLKHSFNRRSYQEWEEIKEVHGAIADRVDDVRLVRGNHDNFVAGSFPGAPFPLSLRVGRLHFVHGHKAVDLGDRAGGDILVLGHEHPSVLLRDSIGASVRLPCFLFHPEEGILVLPAFSPLMKGSDVLSTGFLSKVLVDLEPGEFLAFATSEIGILGLGRLGDIGAHGWSADDLWDQTH